MIAESDGRQNQKSTQLHTFMSRLRETLRRGDPGDRETEASDWLQSVPGIGYQIADPEIARAQGLQLHSEQAAKRGVQSARPRHSGMMLRAVGWMMT